MEIAIVQSGTPEYQEARTFAQHAYRKAYGATTAPSPDRFVTVREAPGGPVAACAGLTGPGSRGFFSENYLGVPVERVLASVVEAAPERDEVVEVGPLAGSGGAGGELIRLLPIIAWCQGKRFILATVTDKVERSMAGAGVPFLPLRQATTHWMDEVTRADWGTYYDRSPTTGVVPLDSIGRLINSLTGRYNFVELAVRTLVGTAQEVSGAHA
ncbi:thermostable hemolysin [Streptomyces sp. NRRL S-1022]|uniref:thermostable hemolysin n=1 Tax=Streptomyces sp. NRRL S-1022 TaxID=1463880 RepID=UPI0004C1CF1E|nr:thermostable hemolysin [Streptomyces sp. NRRL S-1022]